MEILPKLLEYTGPKDLSQYFVKEYRMKKLWTTYMSTKQKAIVVEVILGRQLLSTILTVYVPTILLNVIGHSTNFFKDFFFEAVITVNLTVMLVLVTMFISVSSNLPTTAYVKMIDIWLIFNLLMPFLLVLLHTYMDSLRTENKGDGEGREINHHGKTITVGGGAGTQGEIMTGKSIQVVPADRDSDLIHRNELLELQVKYLMFIVLKKKSIFEYC